MEPNRLPAWSLFFNAIYAIEVYSKPTIGISKEMDITTINSLASNPWITLGGFVIGLLGLVLAVVFYIKAKRERIPCFEHKSRTLIEGVDKTLDGLQLNYRGSSQSRITVTKIVFWNEGRETIDKSDLVIADQIRILCPHNVDILDIQIIKFSNSANSGTLGMPISRDGYQFYPIEFEYLDHKDYLLIQIVHNGDDKQPFKMAGKVKGVSELLDSSSSRVIPKAFELIPFASKLEKMMASRFFMKYAVAGAYSVFASVGVWALIQGMNDWYVWVGTAVCVFAAPVLYFENRIIAPVDI